MKPVRPRCIACTAGVVLSWIAPTASAKTFILPHVFETRGRVTNTNFAFDTTIENIQNVGAPPATLDMYLFDEGTGQPMAGELAPLPLPLKLTVEPDGLKRFVRVEDVFQLVGGLPAGTSLKLGYGVVVVGGADPESVNLQGFVVNSHTSPFDLSVIGFNPEEVRATAQSPPAASQRVLPSLIEAAGTIGSGPGFTFDTTIFITYAAGLGDLPAGGGSASATLRFLRDDGSTVTDAGGPFERTFHFDANNRRALFDLQDLLAATGEPSFSGSAVIQRSGDDWALAADAFVRHGNDPNALLADSYFVSTVPEPAAMPAAFCGGAVWWMLRRSTRTGRQR